VVKVQRRTEGGDAPGWQGATSENTGSIWTRSNAARRDAAPAECSWSFTTGCQGLTTHQRSQEQHRQAADDHSHDAPPCPGRTRRRRLILTAPPSSRTRYYSPQSQRPRGVEHGQPLGGHRRDAERL